MSDWPKRQHSKITQVEVQTQIGLCSDPVERTPVCFQTEITGSGRKFERTTVWAMVWRWSDQRSIWSDKSDQRRLRAQFGLIITSSSALLSDQRRLRPQLGLIITSSSALASDQKCFRTQLGLMRDHFERFFFYFFLFFFYWEMLALSRGIHKAAFWSETHHKSDSSDQKKGVQLIAEAGLLQKKLWSTGDHDVSFEKLFKLIHWDRNIH